MNARSCLRATSLLFSCGLLLIGCGPVNTYQAPPPPPVTVGQPEVRDVTTYDVYPGELRSGLQADLIARVQGILQERLFEPGSTVEKDQLLFVIEKAPFEAALRAAEAENKRAEAAAALAETTYQRKENLFVQNAISELEVLQAEAERDAARAVVLQTQAALENAQINLSYCEIRAPFRGRISEESVNIGNLVGAGGPMPLATIVAEDPIYAYFEVSERAVLNYLRGRAAGEVGDAQGSQQVFFEFVDGTVYEKPGVIDYAGNQISEVTGTLRLRAVFANESRLLVPGSFGRVRVPVPVEQAILVPDLAIQRDLGGEFVLTVDEANVVQKIAVERGALLGNMRIVKRGLEGGETIIVQGLQRARPGLPVTPQTPEPAAATTAN